MIAPRPLKLNLFNAGAAVAFGLLVVPVCSQADLFWAATVNGSSATAGSGTWNNTTLNWSTTAGGLGTTNWNPATGTARFIGTGGGTVTTGANLTVPAIQYDATAATFAINNGNIFSMTGTGISNGSGKAQTYTNNGGTTFSNAATVANTTGGSTTTITNNGDFFFNNTSSSGASIFNNNSNLFYNGTSTGTGTAMTNTGLLDISGHTLGTVTLASLVTSGSTTLGANNLAENTLTLNDGGSLEFDLGTNYGKFQDAGLFTSSSTAGTTTIDLFAGAGIHAGVYSIINFGSSAGLQDSDFVIGHNLLANGFSAAISHDADSVDVTLTAVPEVSSFILPVVGAAALFAFRRRSSRALPARVMA